MLKKIYDGICNGLCRVPWTKITTVFSHGALHLIIFVATCIGIAYFGLQIIYGKNSITPHNLGVYIGSLSDFKYKQDVREDSIENVCLHVRLNSEQIKSETNGKYHNGIFVEFDGKTVKRTVIDAQGKLVEEFLDSVIVALYNEPKLGVCDVTADIDSILGTVYATDSATGVVTATRYKVKETQINYHQTQQDSILSIAIAPVHYGQEQTRHYVNIYTDGIKGEEDSPYYYYYISFPAKKFAKKLVVDFSVSDLTIKKQYNMKYSNGKNLQYNYIYPEPDVMGNGWIEYNSDTKKEQIFRNGGILIQAVDVDALNRQNSRMFLLSVLIGTALAFAIDIFIQLIRELRRLQQKRKDN